MLTSLISCSQTSQRLEAAATKIGEARAEEAPKPDLPGDCYKISRAGAKHGDGPLVIISKYDVALTAQNRRTLRCAEWFETTYGVGGGSGS